MLRLLLTIQNIQPVAVLYINFNFQLLSYIKLIGVIFVQI